MSWGLIRLSLLGSRNSWGRLAGIVGGIALGTATFMLLAGAFTALQTRDDRSMWTDPTVGTALVADDGTPVPLADDVAAVAAIADHYGDRDIARIDIAATPGSTVTVPGVGTPPAAGTYYASPALAELIERLPAEQLGDRYGTLVGTLPDDVLVGPDSLVAVVGTDEATIRTEPGASLVTELVNDYRGASTAYQMIVGIGAIGVFFPVLLFVSIVTQLGAARRTERFATLRLIGASPRTVTRLVAVETVATSVVGVVAGIGLGWALRPVAGKVSLNGAEFFPADLTPSAPVAAGAAFAIVVGTTLAAAHRLRRAGIGPLGATSELHERRPSAWRLIPLVLGLGMLGGLYLAVRAGAAGEATGFLLLLGGFFVTTLGVVVAGPWLTYRVSALAARRATSAAAVIAGSRVRRHPVATFRSVSGLVVAVFMVTVFAVAATSATPYLGMDTGPGLMPTDALMGALPAGADAHDAEAVVAELTDIGGVTGAAVLSGISEGDVFAQEVLMATATDAATLGLGQVPDGAGLVSFAPWSYAATDEGDRARPEAATAGDDATLVPLAVVVRTDGTTAGLERARTAMGALSATAPETRAELNNVGNRRMLDELSLLAYIGALFSIAIAGCSLAVATAAAMIDRRRVLGLLRLVGMPVRQVRRIVTLEAAAPLLAVLGLSVGLGAAVAWCIVESIQSQMSIGMPEPAYFVTLAVGCVVALAMVAAASSSIRRDTAVSSTRFE
jgi:cell division protein FtsX